MCTGGPPECALEDLRGRSKDSWVLTPPCSHKHELRKSSLLPTMKSKELDVMIDVIIVTTFADLLP